MNRDDIDYEILSTTLCKSNEYTELTHELCHDYSSKCYSTAGFLRFLYCCNIIQEDKFNISFRRLSTLIEPHLQAGNIFGCQNIEQFNEIFSSFYSDYSQTLNRNKANTTIFSNVNSLPLSVIMNFQNKPLIEHIKQYMATEIVHPKEFINVDQLEQRLTALYPDGEDRNEARNYFYRSNFHTYNDNLYRFEHIQFIEEKPRKYEEIPITAKCNMFMGTNAYKRFCCGTPMLATKILTRNHKVTNLEVAYLEPLKSSMTSILYDGLDANCRK